MAKHNEVGRIGEDIAIDFLREKGFKVVSRNYRKPYGEIDIIARDTDDVLRFVEVKSVSWETDEKPPSHVSHGTYRPEENVHPEKVRRLMRVIESYLVSHEIDSDWQFDVAAVFVNQKDKKAKVRYLENVVLGS